MYSIIITTTDQIEVPTNAGTFTVELVSVETEAVAASAKQLCNDFSENLKLKGAAEIENCIRQVGDYMLRQTASLRTDVEAAHKPETITVSELKYFFLLWSRVILCVSYLADARS